MKRAFLLLIPLLALSAVIALAATQSVCWNSPTPSGWIKIDHYTDFNTCGNGLGHPVINNNIKVLETYSDKAIGSSMSVCALEPTPAGWQVLYFETTSSQCYISNVTNNVKVIRRVS